MQMLIISVSREVDCSGSMGAISPNHYEMGDEKALKKDVSNVKFKDPLSVQVSNYFWLCAGAQCSVT